MHGKLITQHLLRYAHQSLDSASEGSMCMHIKGGIQRLMPVTYRLYYREVQIRGNAPIPNTHLATPTFHPTWLTHQVSLSYLQYGPFTNINNTPKSLSNGKTYIVTETYEACYPTRFEERIPQLGFCLGKDPCHVMSIHGLEPFSLLSNNSHPCTRINITDLGSCCLLMSSPVSSTNRPCCQVLLLS